jgi:hypothetical protein
MIWYIMHDKVARGKILHCGLLHNTIMPGIGSIFIYVASILIKYNLTG